MAYDRVELDLKDNSESEQIRTRKIFEDLKAKAERGEKLTEHESDFFCQGVKLSLLDDGNIDDYNCCSNYKFKTTYLVYFRDLLGNGIYEKVKGTSLYNPDYNEINKDIEYLKRVEADWLSTINITNHSDELLKQISKETREELKNLEKTKGRLLFKRDKLNYVKNKRSIILQSKYIYCTALEIFEMFDKKEFLLNLNGKEIEINEYSIIHILSRHFAQTTKPLNKKSFHIEDIEPRYLNKQLKNIFQDIDVAKLLNGKSINKIAFQYKNIDYLIWINEQTKQIKGKGNVQFNRLETFYPVEEQADIKDLKENYSLETIKEDLKVYVSKN